MRIDRLAIQRIESVPIFTFDLPAVSSIGRVETDETENGNGKLKRKTETESGNGKAEIWKWSSNLTGLYQDSVHTGI